MAKIPEQLENIWDKEVKECLNALNTKQKAFLLEWFGNGFNGSAAYRKVYNKLANDDISGSRAWQIFTNLHISNIVKKLNEAQDYELTKCKQVYHKALEANKPVFKDGEMIMEVEDHKTRIDAAERLTKLNGQIVNRNEQTHKFPEPVIFRNPDGEVYKKIEFNDD